MRRWWKGWKKLVIDPYGWEELLRADACVASNILLTANRPSSGNILHREGGMVGWGERARITRKYGGCLRSMEMDALS